MDTALIVEDDPDQANLAAQFVRLRGYEPVLAATGEEGLSYAASVCPDVVLLDLMLPDTDGFEVCRILKSERQTMSTPIVMVTALNSDQHRLRGFRVGANAYVTKPYGAQELFDAIAAARAWKAGLDQASIEGELHLELNSESPFLQDVNDLLGNLCRHTPLTQLQISQLRQGVMEMGQNAIEWGNRHNAEKLVQITYRLYPDRVEIVVTDEGSGFDQKNLAHAASPDDPVAHMDVREKLGLREGGFGMLISRGMLDELNYNDVGNQVTIVKRFDAVGGTPEAAVP